MKPTPSASAKPETALIMLGCGAAALSAAFAAYSVTMSGPLPAIPGNEHLLIFTRPALARQSEPVSVAASDIGLNPLDTDPITTGSIRANRPGDVAGDVRLRPRPAERPQTLVPGFALRGIFNGKALLQGPDGFVMAGEGFFVRGAGTIRSIEATRKGWAVTTSEGRIE